MSNENAPGGFSPESQGANSVGQTGNVGPSTSVASGAAKVFKEFKWGLLTLFLLMVVVIGLVYDGGRKKKLAEADPSKGTPTTDTTIDTSIDTATPPPGGAPTAAPAPIADTTPLPPPPQQPGNHNAPVIDMDGTPPPPAAPVAAPAPGLGEPKPAKAPAKTDVVKPTHEKHDEEKAAPGSERTYVVQNGDTLTKIANTQCPGKGNVKALLAANKDVLPDPNKVKVGMKLKIPVLASDETKKPDLAKTSAPANKTAEKKTEKSEKSEKAENPKAEKTDGEDYVVQSGDTLEKIARKVLNDGRKWRELYEWNRDQVPDPGRLRVGQVLKVKESAAIKPANLTVPKPHAEATLPSDEKPAATEKVAKHTSEKPNSKATDAKLLMAPKVETAIDDVQSCSTSAFAP